MNDKGGMKRLREIESNAQVEPDMEFLTLVSRPVKKVNHGKVFGKRDWFTFYCGKCGVQLKGRQERCRCGVIAEWEGKRMRDKEGLMKERK